ncbi:MAG: hypothetical protein JXJ22_17420 [Bacteroidales bacterium]|nr:hypothetical protein [Bacteroidales bacterium]
MRKMRTILLWISIIIYFIVMLGFVSEKHSKTLCNRLDIILTDSLEGKYINEEDILKILEKQKVQILGTSLESINLKELEDIFKTINIIERVALYITEDGTLHIKISQKNPLVRIRDGRRRDYFLDEYGNIINVSNRYSPHILLANGSIKVPFDPDKDLNIWSVPKDEIKADKKVIYDLLKLSKFINQNEFWKAQIVQIYVTDKQEFELIPRVGAHIIEFGDITDYKIKFENLHLLYKDGLSREGWNNFLVINLKYKNQIVCTKI